MTTQNHISGKKHKVYTGDGGDPESWSFFCIATTAQHTRATQFNDVTLPDCADPDAILVRTSEPVSRSFDQTLSGVCDNTKYNILRAAQDEGETIRLKILDDVPLAQGGGYFAGDFHIENLVKAKADQGIVTFTCSLRGQGDIPWTDADA